MSTRIHDWQADFAMFDQRGQLVAIAEATTKATGPGWATAWFRNYFEHQGSAGPPFEILATPAKLYLWKRPYDGSSPEPTAVADTGRLYSPAVLSRYLFTGREDGRVVQDRRASA